MKIFALIFALLLLKCSGQTNFQDMASNGYYGVSTNSVFGIFGNTVTLTSNQVIEMSGQAISGSNYYTSTPVAATNWIPSAITNVIVSNIGQPVFTNVPVYVGAMPTVQNLNTFLTTSITLDPSSRDGNCLFTLVTSGNTQVGTTNYFTITPNSVTSTNRLFPALTVYSTTNSSMANSTRFLPTSSTSNLMTFGTTTTIPSISTTYMGVVRW